MSAPAISEVSDTFTASLMGGNPFSLDFDTQGINVVGNSAL